MRKIHGIICFILPLISVSGQETLKDKRDGNQYRTITVQGATWLAENLRFKTPSGSDSFDHDSINLRKYGILYDWTTAMKACPKGWRLPTGAEFRNLVNYNDQRENWKSRKNDPDSFGIQLAGMQDFEGNFTEMEESAYFWTSTEYGKDNAEYVSYMIVTDNPVVDVSRKEDIQDVHGTEKSNKYSVRCIRVN